MKEYLNEKPFFHTFLLADIEQYGFDKKFQTVYLQEKDGQCEGVFLKYFNNFILAGDESLIEFEQLSHLISDEITTIMGKVELVSGVVEHISKQTTIVRNNLYVHKNHHKEVINEQVHFASLEDVDRIHEFLMSFPEFVNLYSEKEMLVNRLKNNEGIHLYIEKDGKIIAHGNSAAAAEKTCMIGGLCVAKPYRGLGYAKMILQMLCNHIHEQEKTPCIFASQEKAYSIFSELGFTVYGEWGVTQIIR